MPEVLGNGYSGNIQTAIALVIESRGGDTQAWGCAPAHPELLQFIPTTL
jgi:hypothetical protein